MENSNLVTFSQPFPRGSFLLSLLNMTSTDFGAISGFP